MEEITVFEIRRDLRKIRYCEKYIETINERIRKPSVCTSSSVQAKLQNAIDEVVRLKERYYPIILTLDKVDQIIIFESVIGGKTYADIASELYYSTEGITKRSQSAMKKIRNKLSYIGVT